MTEFQMKIKHIIRGEYEFTEDEKALIRKLWLSEEELQQQQATTYYAKQKAKAKVDFLYKEWRRVTNGLNVTLQRVKKDGKPRDESIKRYLELLKGIVENGFDPNGVRRSPINWDESFKQGKVVYYKDS